MHRLFSRLSDFYPRPPRGGRPSLTNGERDALEISIHALREEGDPILYVRMIERWKFLSTPSARRATKSGPTSGRTTRISIHALREEGDPLHQFQHPKLRNFYPRPPRGGRLLRSLKMSLNALFLSTPSARRATTAGEAMPLHLQISIHALREEGDWYL